MTAWLRVRSDLWRNVSLFRELIRVQLAECIGNWDERNRNVRLGQ